VDDAAVSNEVSSSSDAAAAGADFKGVLFDAPEVSLPPMLPIPDELLLVLLLPVEFVAELPKLLPLELIVDAPSVGATSFSSAPRTDPLEAEPENAAISSFARSFARPFSTR
jgi:hypothetical protein